MLDCRCKKFRSEISNLKSEIEREKGRDKMEFRDFSLYVNQTKVGRFAEDLGRGEITATVCRKCGKKYYPPRADCSECMGSEMDWVSLEGKGTLISYTTIYVPPDHFAIRQPSMPFCAVRLEPCPMGLLEVEDGLRVMGWIPKVDPGQIQTGMRLKAVPQSLPNGRVTIVLEAL